MSPVNPTLISHLLLSIGNMLSPSCSMAEIQRSNKILNILASILLLPDSPLALAGFDIAPKTKSDYRWLHR